MMRAISAASVLAAAPAYAANPAFQDFFTTVCENATGMLATRCGETVDGGGSISSDSESSLNPNQTFGAEATTRDATRGSALPARGEFGDAGAPMAQSWSVGRLSVLLGGHYLGERLNRPPSAASRGYALDAWAVRLGADYRLSPALVFGGAFGTERTALSFDRERPGTAFTPARRAGTVDQTGHSATLFASMQPSPRSFLDVSTGLTGSRYLIHRNAVFQESRREVAQTDVRARGRTRGRQTWVAASAGYGATFDAWSLTPHVGVSYQHGRVDGYRERDISGSGLALVVRGRRTTSLVGQAGLRVTRAWSRPGYVLLPQLGVEYVHMLQRDTPSAVVAFQLDEAGNTLALQGDARRRSHAEVDAGVIVLLPGGWMPALQYQTTLGERDLRRHRIALGLRREL